MAAAQAQLDAVHIILRTCRPRTGTLRDRAAYRSLVQVERVFRSMTRGQPSVCPVHVCSEDHVHGHVLLCMLEARDNEGNTPLHVVFESEVQLGPKELPRGLQPISMDIEAVEVLIKVGTDLEVRNHEANTPLHLAVKYVGEINGVVYGIDEDTGWHLGLTGPQPHHAGDAIRVLLAAGADPGSTNEEGRIPCEFYRSNIFLRSQEIGLCP